MNIHTYKSCRKFLIRPLTILLSTLILSSCGGGSSSSAPAAGQVKFTLDIPSQLTIADKTPQFADTFFSLDKNDCFTTPIQDLKKTQTFTRVYAQNAAATCNFDLQLNIGSALTKYTIKIINKQNPTFPVTLKHALDSITGAPFAVAASTNRLSISFKTVTIINPFQKIQTELGSLKTIKDHPLALAIVLGGGTSTATDPIPYCWSKPVVFSGNKTPNITIPIDRQTVDGGTPKCKATLGFYDIDEKTSIPDASVIFENGKLATISSSVVDTTTQPQDPKQNENTLYSIGSFNTWAQEVARNLGDTIDLDKSKDNVNNFITSSLPFAIDSNHMNYSLDSKHDLITLASGMIKATSDEVLKKNYENGSSTVDGRATTSMDIAQRMLVYAAILKLTHNNTKSDSLFAPDTYKNNLNNLITYVFNQSKNSNGDISFFPFKYTKAASSCGYSSLLADSYIATAMSLYKSVYQPADKADIDAYLKAFQNHDMNMTDDTTGKRVLNPNPTGRYPQASNDHLPPQLPYHNVLAYSQLAPQLLLRAAADSKQTQADSKQTQDEVVSAYFKVFQSAFVDMFTNVNPDTEIRSISPYDPKYHYLPYRFDGFDDKCKLGDKDLANCLPEYYPTMRGDFYVADKGGDDAYREPWTPGDQPELKTLGRYEYDPRILGRLGGFLLASHDKAMKAKTPDQLKFKKFYNGETTNPMSFESYDKTPADDVFDSMGRYMLNVDLITSYNKTYKMFKDYNQYIYCLGGQKDAVQVPTCEHAFTNSISSSPLPTTIPVLCDYLLARLGLLVNNVDGDSSLVVSKTQNYLAALSNKGVQGDPDRMALLLAGFYMDGVFNEQHLSTLQIPVDYDNPLVKYHNKIRWLLMVPHGHNEEHHRLDLPAGAQTSYTGVKKKTQG